ncbi:MAG: thioredoxin domain-containing protein [Alphaproteobacteria bacterium]|nr:thioredoxin domain-containing protein [Alphaproteobacteria bacterium]
MSETEEKNKKYPLTAIIVVFALLGAVVLIGLLNNAKKSIEEGQETEQTTVVSSNTSEIQETSEQSPEQTDLNPAAGAELLTEAIQIDVEKAGTPRIMGDPTAKVKISEHSSFTCGACSAFHKDNFKRLKAEYLDTGKAYLVFDDFPRNQYDLQVGAVARCVPEDAYFNFVQLLFETQQDWLNDDFLSYVKQNAKLTGISEERIDACLENKDLLETLADRQRSAYENHGVNSTPTLIINDTTKVIGVSPYEDIKKAIDAELAK